MQKNNTLLIMFVKSLVYLSLALLFIVSVTYFYLVDDGIFFYQENKLLFIFSSEYLQKFTVKPGGLLEYAGNFLTQGYYSYAYGSLIVSSLFILLCIVFIKINIRLSSDRSFTLLFIMLPSCFLLLLQKSYDHLMHYNLGFLIVAFYFLFSVSSEKKLLNFVILALFPIFFFVVGSFSFIYLGMFIIYSALYKKGILRYFLPAFLIVIALFTFIVFKEFLFLQPVGHLLRYPFPVIELSWYPAFLCVLCGYYILFPLVIKISGSFNVKKKLAGVFLIATVLTIFPIIVFLLFKYQNQDRVNLGHIEKSVLKKDWDSIIKQHENYPTTNLIGQYYYNLALAEKGQLCDRLFFDNQDFGAESLTLPHDNEHINRAVYFYYSIGLISEAHHLAYESMVRFGYNPENIKLLIKTNIINGHYKLAERYINVLKKTSHYRDYALKYEEMLKDTELIKSDQELVEKFSLLPKKDFFIRSNDRQNIELFLLANTENKKAFEYKIAWLLFEKDVESVAYEVKKMKKMGYTNIPLHIEEALLTFINIYKENPDLGGLTISPETELHFLQYNTTYDLYKNGNKSRHEAEMKKLWGNTFWFYLQFK